ncbi:hypothetical protein [Anaeromyxobacter oryzae]|uniref:Late embryogenesis abundant protein n=1 Tax=Anaeromyxobacter oryzae TaxID=2918170 RepID=A0ABM7WT36_9BACT|nr:hypothetical protein [Anaeromyxobacter oryzae]BDG02630.1 hypothetical protein AMOR_16260 [Anaeromyxobacter oryzae]
MASFRLRRERRSRARAIVAVSAGGIAAGAALFYFLDPRRGGERRARASQALRGAPGRVEATARDLGERAGRTLRDTRGKVERGVQEATERARGAADEVRETAAQGREALARRGVTNDQALQGAAGGVLLARAIFGGGLLRIPAGIAGISVLARLASRSDSLHRGVQRTRDVARSAADRLREQIEGAEGHERQHGGGGSGRQRGGARRQPEVREAKSPSELEPGVASGHPEPTYRDRADRSGPHMGRGRGDGGGPRGGGYDAAADVGEDGGFLAPGTDDVTPASEFDAPEPGASVREGELGSMRPPDEEEESAPRIIAPDEAGANPSARILGPDERPVGSGAAEADAARRDPTSDGG